MFERIRLARMIARDMDANPDKWRFERGICDPFVTDGTFYIDDDGNWINKPFRTCLHLTWAARILRRGINRLRIHHARLALVRQIVINDFPRVTFDRTCDLELTPRPS